MTATRSLKVVVQKGPLAGTELNFASDRPVTIGREGADVQLTGDDFVSARHADITFTPRGVVLRNRSDNGTLVNGTPVTEAVLAIGDTVSVGLLHLLKIAGLPAPVARTGARTPKSEGPRLSGGVAASVKPGRKRRRVPLWLVLYLVAMVLAGLVLGIAKFRGSGNGGLAEVRQQEERYAATRQWPEAQTARVLHLLETAVVHERRGDPRSAYEIYREALSMRHPIDPRSPAYRFAAGRMAELGPSEPRRR